MSNYSFLVRVGCLTYNHAPYITDTMNGFCMQETNFPFVCTIIDDASTDGEPEVIKKYLEDNFNLKDASINRNEETDDYSLIYARHKTNRNCFFAVVLLKYNHYKKKSKAQYISEWLHNSKYVALCEGDDYWTDSMKLQKQVEYLENHHEYSMCYHAVNHISNGIICGNDRRFEKECDISTEQIIEGGGGFCATCSLVYRKDCLYNLPKYFHVAKVGDAPLQVFLATKGKIRYFPFLMAVYRKNVPGSWTSKVWEKDRSKPYLNAIEWLLDFNKESNSKYEKSVLKRIYPYICYLYSHNNIDKWEKYHILKHFSLKSIYDNCGKRVFLNYLFCSMKNVFCNSFFYKFITNP